MSNNRKKRSKPKRLNKNIKKLSFSNRKSRVNDPGKIFKSPKTRKLNLKRLWLRTRNLMIVLLQLKLEFSHLLNLYPRKFS